MGGGPAIRCMSQSRARSGGQQEASGGRGDAGGEAGGAGVQGDEERAGAEADTALDAFEGARAHHGVLLGVGDGVNAAEADEGAGDEIKLSGGAEGRGTGQGCQGAAEGQELPAEDRTQGPSLRSLSGSGA